MGGFILTSPDYDQGFPINAEQLFYLVKHGHIDLPYLREKEIKEKSKADTLSKSVYLNICFGWKLMVVILQIDYHLASRVVYNY